MAQQEVINYLVRKRNKPTDIVELTNNIGINRTNISRACRKLRATGEIKIKKVKIKGIEKFLIYLP